MKAIESKHMGWIAAALMASGLAVAGVASANGGGHGDPAKRQEMLDKYDANDDGKLDKQERQIMKEERHQEMLNKFDKNKDGKLDDAEHKAIFDEHATTAFKAMDKNADGQLSLDEFKAGAAEHHGKGGPHRGRHHGGKKNK
jgi:Ca2+-binding EF-hand superfamily protein